ncbi:MAG: RNA polymerase sigma factor, partial [Lachnospiraceae bacterium]|nr:RNA polymerase sigma factor [Lachnospiraceae bacterium]
MKKGAGTIETEEQFKTLLTRYEKLVYTLCYRMTNNLFDAQDLTQDTFLSAYQRLPDFDGEHERAWICRIAVNKCLDHQKSAARRIQPAEEETFSALPDQNADPETACLLEESRKEVLALCRQLP